MPGTMFTEVVSPRGSSHRKWHTVPLSLIVHAAIFAVIIVAPLVATGELLMPERLMPSFVIANVVPSPPPAAPRSRLVTTRATATNTQVPPLEAHRTLVRARKIGEKGGSGHHRGGHRSGWQSSGCPGNPLNSSARPGRAGCSRGLGVHADATQWQASAGHHDGDGALRLSN
jgi:hypothetical protein